MFYVMVAISTSCFTASTVSVKISVNYGCLNFGILLRRSVVLWHVDIDTLLKNEAVKGTFHSCDAYAFCTLAM